MQLSRDVSGFVPLLMISHPATGFDRAGIRECLANLSCGATVIKGGHFSKVEASGKYDSYDGMLNVTCTAVEEGILPGGGMALLKASLALSSSTLGVAMVPRQSPFNVKHSCQTWCETNSNS